MVLVVIIRVIISVIITCCVGTIILFMVKQMTSGDFRFLFFDIITKMHVLLILNTTFHTFIFGIMWSWCSACSTYSIELSLSSRTIFEFTFCFFFLAFGLMIIPRVRFLLFIHSLFLMPVVLSCCRCCYFMVIVCDWFVICAFDVRSYFVSSIDIHHKL